MDSNEELLWQGRRISVVRRWQPTADGQRAAREVVVHPGAVVILPWVDEEHVCLIRNRRIAVNETLIELPAGTLEPNEPPIETARRELIEETGYHCDRIVLLQEFYPSPGIMSERMYLYAAFDLTAGESALEEGEEIETRVTPWEEAVRMAAGGEIRDSKTLVGILLANQLKQSGVWAERCGLS